MRVWVVFVLWLLAAAFPARAGDTYSIATGSPSGLYYPFGGGLASVWSKHYPELNIKAEVTGGSVVNIIQVAKGESELGISQGDALREAVAGAGKYPKPMPVRALFALYPNIVHVVTLEDSQINHLDDLRGKRVSIGAPGSGTAITTLNLLEVLGITPNDFEVQYLSYTETSDGLKNGTIDAGFMVGGLGLAAIVELALTRDIRMIEFTDAQMARIHAAYPAYTAFTLPAEVYRGIDSPLQTASLWNFLIVHRDMPEAMARKLAEAAFSARQQMHQVTKSARFMTPANALKYGAELLHGGVKDLMKQLTAIESDAG